MASPSLDHDKYGVWDGGEEGSGKFQWAEVEVEVEEVRRPVEDGVFEQITHNFWKLDFNWTVTTLSPTSPFQFLCWVLSYGHEGVGIRRGCSTEKEGGAWWWLFPRVGGFRENV